MLFIKDEYTSRFANFTIIGLFSFSANSDIFSLLLVPPEVLAADLPARVAESLSKMYKSSKLAHVHVCHILDFVLIALLRNTLLEAVLLENSLKSPWP